MRPRARQFARQGCLNAELSGQAILDEVRLDATGEALLSRANGRFNLSARSAHRVLRVARTIADLGTEFGGVDTVTSAHLAEALSYRALDWERGLGMTAF